MEIDLNYVSQHARSKVDIVLVMDVSGSIDVEEFEKAKVFSKNLLEYFSIAQGHGQVSNQITDAKCRYYRGEGISSLKVKFGN